MAYRDGDELARRDAIERRLAAMSARDPERHPLADELTRIDAARREAARRHLPQIARARIASPCGEGFDTMLGEGAVRSCARCDQQVFDVARMTLGEAEALLQSRGPKVCLRLHVRGDGTMLFADA